MPGTAVASSADPSVARSDHVLASRHSSPSGARDANVGRVDRISAPARIHLLAVRVYWGATHPSYPSTQRVRHDLNATADYYERISRGHQEMHVQLTRWIHVRADAD